ncbi:MAG: 1-deoxy-D-xylulose-5-phosphate reductoisomerase [Rhodobacteraceae bacterium]|nr:1-deoxy-D-xylulose-5-phosphate reductoisomerase [Paracoccaceae bacterium]
MRRVSVFGATGSIGRNTVDLLRRQGGASAFDVVALSGGHNIALLAEQARNLNAEIAVTAYPEHLDDLRDALQGTGIIAAAGNEAIAEAAARPTDWAMSAIGGYAGLRPGLALLEHGGVLALANKESLVAAGPLMLAEAARHKATILPVDSEHSAIFQALVGEDINRVQRLILTASGGPFRDWSAERIARATPEQAMAHPNWQMGQMISVDSASMFNKALEMIEAKEFYGVGAERIEVIVHPQSIIHSMVAFIDGSIMAHMGTPDMRFAIGYALNWPERGDLPVAPLDLAAMGRLDFEAPDEDRFPALRLARRVMAMGGLAGAVFNAAKEVAYDAFMAHQIGFADMAIYVERALDSAESRGDHNATTFDLDNVIGADRAARIATREAIGLRQAS